MLPHEVDHWRGMLTLSENTTVAEFVGASVAAGDACLYRLYTHLQTYSGNYSVWEQIDKQYGTQKSAYNLTWSYANILRALYVRNTVLADISVDETSMEQRRNKMEHNEELIE